MSQGILSCLCKPDHLLRGLVMNIAMAVSSAVGGLPVPMAVISEIPFISVETQANSCAPLRSLTYQAWMTLYRPLLFRPELSGEAPQARASGSAK